MAEGRRGLATANDTRPPLRVEGLTVQFMGDQGPTTVVDDVSFELRRGRTLGLVGESGSGKTVLCLALLGLVRPPGHIAHGRVELDGLDLRSLSQRELTRVRGRQVSMVFQDARRSLDPAFTVGEQIAEVVRRHERVSRTQAWSRAVEMLARVQIANPDGRARQYPHEFSGGMAQRALIAMALGGRPDVLIADEPTTALDVTTQQGVLELLLDLQEDFGLSVLFVTHDLALVAEVCHDVAVMYSGQLVERGATEEVFLRPQHPYTQMLLDSLPQLDGADRGGAPLLGPNVLGPPSTEGCRFAPRCPHRAEQCTGTALELVELDGADRSTRCVRHEQLVLDGLGGRS